MGKSIAPLVACTEERRIANRELDGRIIVEHRPNAVSMKERAEKLPPDLDYYERKKRMADIPREELPRYQSSRWRILQYDGTLALGRGFGCRMVSPLGDGDTFEEALEAAKPKQKEIAEAQAKAKAGKKAKA